MATTVRLGACGKHLGKVVTAALAQGMKSDAVLVAKSIVLLPNDWCGERGCGNPAIYMVAGSTKD